MLGIEMRYVGAHPMKRRTWHNEVSIPTMREGLEFWHAKYRPKHFTEQGAVEYKYMKRRGQGMTDRTSKAFRNSYTGRKLRERGHEKPLVLSGLSEKLSKIRDIRVNSKRGRAILPGGFNRRHKKSRINMREEVTRISTAEEKVLIHNAGLSVTKKIAAVKSVVIKKI